VRNVGVGNLELIGCHGRVQFSVDAYHIQEKMLGSATGAAGFPQEDFTLLMSQNARFVMELLGHQRGGYSSQPWQVAQNNATNMHGVLACE
jgi:hypothetical protein